MQSGFGFSGHDDILRWQRMLAPMRTVAVPLPRRSPIGALVKSMISGRTRDPVSLAAYDRLVAAFGTPGRVLMAGREEVLRCIGGVTHAEDKAGYVVGALGRIAAERKGFDLSFLATPPIVEALGWLERLPGVGRKVAAATLNASTLDRPVLIVDSHVLRVLQRLGFVDRHAEARTASEAVTAAMPEWDGGDFLDFHIAIKKLGQRFCRFEAPDCARCPLRIDCRSRC
ncbi:endonuclease III domain-containing protein [Sphingomonas psychrotolerans]|uniref:Endonuclease n=1 Tax=Sphingomonas psychrotolerans TaxID=1327635 RepID=A0A2K8MLW4_9SPHN|nr:endonuclease [Sphingomonas psychrotolerans]ATY32759.1 endonuclease [Sphingomonas psychrotolerans]